MTMHNGSEDTSVDVAIIGGGPAGTTTASLLRKYAPDLRVLILEKEAFPRDHIGESQLPAIGAILEEMGVWDKVEAADFPIKIGASYTWGSRRESWEFNFYPPEEWSDDPRPTAFEGQRRFTAFQVDRAVYDNILLRHAESMGVEVREQTAVEEVLHSGEHVDGLKLASGEIVTARHYVDASGVVGLLRRALGIGVKVTEELRNIAIWDYWRDARWPIEVGRNVTRVQVRSLPYGWIWFIPISPSRTSVGLIVPVAHYKALDISPEQLYLQALQQQPQIAPLIDGATREGSLRSCKDWSQLSDRLIGENWVLVGEACGFADPILSAGMSLAHSAARDAAYTILELNRREHDTAWLRERYDERHRTNIGQHIRFAQFWYASNGCFTDLREHCSRIARDAGIRMSPNAAWNWLSRGGFTSEHPGLASLGTFDTASARQLISLFDHDDPSRPDYLMNGYNEFKLNLRGATKGKVGRLHNGRIEQIDCWERGGRRLPLFGVYKTMINVLQQTSDIQEIVESIRRNLRAQSPGAADATIDLQLSLNIQALDVMIDGLWVTRKLNRKKPMITFSNDGSRFLRWTSDERAVLKKGSIAPIKSNLDLV